MLAPFQADRSNKVVRRIERGGDLVDESPQIHLRGLASRHLPWDQVIGRILRNVSGDPPVPGFDEPARALASQLFCFSS
jgi:hypothetical protein